MTRFLLCLITLVAGFSVSAERSYLCLDSVVADGHARFALPDLPASRLVVEVRGCLQGDREQIGESRQWWGMEFDNGLAVSMRRGNTAYGDAADTRYVRLQIRQGDSLLLDRRFDKILAVDRNRGVSLIVSFSADGMVEVMGGETVPKLLFSGEIDAHIPSSVTLVADGKLRIDGLVAEIEPDRVAPLITEWTSESLSNRFAASRDPLEGFWTYFDRENDPLYARPGGRYTLACIADDDGGYTLIYVDGAQVNASQWRAGMIKGRLIPTPFRDQYDLIWYDAEMLPITADIHARVEQNALMTLSFPLLKTTLRLAKQARQK